MQELIWLFKKVNGIIHCIRSDNWMFIIHPTPKQKHSRVIFEFYYRGYLSHKEISEVTDRELIKLWPHRTRKSCFGEYKTEDKLKLELQRRGFDLSLNGKWIKK